MAFDLGGLLSQFTGGGSTANATDQFHQVAQNAPPDLLSQGIAALFHSDQTPPFSQIAGQLFSQANPGQQAGMLNQLLSAMGPAVLASLAGAAGSGALGGILTQTASAGTPNVTPEQAAALTPEQVQLIASHAEQHNPGIVEKMSGFYAEHPGLVKTLGSAALAIALAKMAQSHKA